jgi:hypothetical protein
MCASFDEHPLVANGRALPATSDVVRPIPAEEHEVCGFAAGICAEGVSHGHHPGNDDDSEVVGEAQGEAGDDHTEEKEVARGSCEYARGHAEPRHDQRHQERHWDVRERPLHLSQLLSLRGPNGIAQIAQ